MANTSVSSQGHTPLPKSWVDDRMRDLFDVKPPRLFPLESKVFESVKNRITGYESLDLERYYYSSDLGTRLEKKNWWNGVRVAVVNFFTGGKYELKNLVYNVNLVCFHSNADMHATFKYENIRQVDQKLREKRSDLLFNSNAPSKNVIKRYENQVMQDFIRNCDLINTPAVNSSDSYLPPISSSNSTSPRLLTSRVLPSGPLPDEDEDFDHRQTVSTPPSSVSSLSRSVSPERPPSPASPPPSPSRAEQIRRTVAFRAVMNPLNELVLRPDSDYADQKLNHITAANAVLMDFRREADFLNNNRAANEDAIEQLETYINQLEQAIAQVQGDDKNVIVEGISTLVGQVAGVVGGAISTIQENFHREDSPPPASDPHDLFAGLPPPSRDIGGEIVDGLSGIAGRIGDGFSDFLDSITPEQASSTKSETRNDPFAGIEVERPGEERDQSNNPIVDGLSSIADAVGNGLSAIGDGFKGITSLFGNSETE